ncbi:MAG: DsbA family protein [Sandaracinaceae bacterium]
MVEPDSELLYFADPMCSWCWGFLPTVERLAAQYEARAPVSVVMAGLHCGTQKALEPGMKDTIRCHWDRVREASGQPFDATFFDRVGFVYDTEPSCRAVVAARRIVEASALPVLARLHRAFYAENRDITDEGTIIALVAEHLGLSETRFADVFQDDETLLETDGDFQLARELGVRRFPTLLARSGCALTVITEGFSPFDRVAEPLAACFEGAAE